MNKKRHVSSAIYDDTGVSLGFLQEQIRNMRRFRGGGRAKPHKLIMLLSVLDMIERGLVSDGKVYFNRDLIECFSFYFGLVEQATDSCRPHTPFFHLRTLGWWRLQPKVGRETSFSEMKTCHSRRALIDNVEYAQIAKEVYELLLDSQARRAIRRTIAEALGALELVEMHCLQTQS